MRTDRSNSHHGGGLPNPSDRHPVWPDLPSNVTPLRKELRKETPLRKELRQETPSGRIPPVNRMTDACENITVHHTLYAVSKYCSPMDIFVLWLYSDSKLNFPWKPYKTRTHICRMQSTHFPIANSKIHIRNTFIPILQWLLVMRSGKNMLVLLGNVIEWP